MRDLKRPFLANNTALFQGDVVMLNLLWVRRCDYGCPILARSRHLLASSYQSAASVSKQMMMLYDTRVNRSQPGTTWREQNSGQNCVFHVIRVPTLKVYSILPLILITPFQSYTRTGTKIFRNCIVTILTSLDE